jgi:signal transduction histidine kinase
MTKLMADQRSGMGDRRAEAVSAITRARGDLDRAFARLEVLTDADLQRVSYSVHALNNYLMVVSMTVQILKARLSARGDRDIRRSLDSLTQATNLMMSTARGVLTATPDVIPPLLFETASLAEIAAGAYQSYRGIAQRKGIRLSWRGTSKPDRVITDCVAAGAVIDNLLSNAVKYSEPGTTVVVAVRTGHNEVVCSVSDRGPGLSEADQARLFQRGVRLSAQPTGGETSTGYGLAIAKDLTTALHGSLTCASTLGVGTSFVFSLPLAPPDLDIPNVAQASDLQVNDAFSIPK